MICGIILHRNEIRIMSKKATQVKSIYPTELVEKAKFEMAIFERVSAETGNELIAEVLRLRAQVNEMLVRQYEERSSALDLGSDV